MFGDVRSEGIMHRRQTGRGYKELQDVYMLTKQSINNGTILNTKRHNNRLLSSFQALLELFFATPVLVCCVVVQLQKSKQML